MNIKIIFIFFFFLLALTTLCTATNFMDSTFSRQTMCDIEARLDNRCSKSDSTVRSLLECLTLCGHTHVCIGASLTSEKQCFVHKTCPEVTACTIESSNHRYFSKNCENGGKWQPESLTCQCVNGWVGERCNELPKSCDDLTTHGYSTGPHSVTLDLSDKSLPNIDVVCYIKKEFSFIYLMLNGGKINQGRDWAAFRNGYESGASHTWLGLDKWHILSEAGYNSLTFKGYFYTPKLTEIKWHYYGFKLSPEEDKYVFSFDHATNETTGGEGIGYQFGDCLGDLQGVPFSTWDQDHDTELSENCAERMGAGWWYSSCDGACHVLGWSQGYLGLVSDERLIDLAGVDMDNVRPKLMLLEMHLKTPAGV